MSEIRLNSQEWANFVFEDKNKKYGAYNLRTTSSKRHVAGIIIVLGLTILAAVIPLIVKAVSDYQQRNKLIVENTNETIQLTKVNLEEQVPENIVKQEMVPPPPPLRQTIAYVPPVIAPREEVADDVVVHTVEEIQASTDPVSIEDILSGLDEGVDIGDIERDKPIVGETDIPLDFVEQMPQFVGGDKKMYEFIKNNLEYPVVALENGKQGRVSVRFVVDKNGDISNVEIMRGIHPACDAEAIRVIEKMPRWIPGKQNGESVPVNFNLQIVFQIGNS